MICLSITPSSRQLAKVDLLNASRQGDLVELCIDRLIKEPDFKDLLAHRRKPVLISCRRTADGGGFAGTEAERQMLLRQAIIAGPDYIEVEEDVAGSIPRFGSVKRVISFTSLKQPLHETDIEEAFQQATQLDADVIKFTWPTPTLDAAWPLLVAVSRKRGLPVVGLGLGPSGLAFSLLGRKYGSPWIYAALEQGMEAFPGQPTVNDLDEIYHWRPINSHTRFVAIAGAGLGEQIASRVLNAGFEIRKLNYRALPIQVAAGSPMARMLEILKIPMVLALPAFGTRLFELAVHVDESLQASRYADFYIQQPDGWHGYSLLWRQILRSVCTALGRDADTPDLSRKTALVVGHGGLAQTLVDGLKRSKAVVSLASADDQLAATAAAKLQVRFVKFAQLYDTPADILLVTEPQRKGAQEIKINPSICRPDMVVADVSAIPMETALAEEGQIRAANVIDVAPIFVDYLSTAFKSLTGTPLPPEALEQGLA